MNHKYLVVSDNHGSLRNLKTVFHTFKKEIDGVIHCGDVECPVSALEDLAGCPVYVAKGNCDYVFDREIEALFELGGDHVACVTHGHRYGAGWDYEPLLEHAAELGADVVFYGHTHRPDFQRIFYDGREIVIMNPGSIERPRQYKPQGPTFATIEIRGDGSLLPQFYLIDRKRGGKIVILDMSSLEA